MLEDILREIRIHLGEVERVLGGWTEFDYSDETLVQYTKTSNNYLFAVGILDTEYTITDEVLPEGPYIDTLLIAIYAAHTIVSVDLGKKVRDGELGIRFKTGQDEISTVEASKKISEVSDGLRKKHRDLVTSKLSGNTEAYVRIQ